MEPESRRVTQPKPFMSIHPPLPPTIEGANGTARETASGISAATPPLRPDMARKTLPSQNGLVVFGLTGHLMCGARTFIVASDLITLFTI
jgi:hypothetical protein